mmetsp:Transcript_1864/g.5552  ORF Transcript_1864/g.5552 Transcript_1864/m.5552 type:complete len:206 (-) Transcript_1864:2-619(-)
MRPSPQAPAARSHCCQTERHRRPRPPRPHLRLACDRARDRCWTKRCAPRSPRHPPKAAPNHSLPPPHAAESHEATSTNRPWRPHPRQLPPLPVGGRKRLPQCRQRGPGDGGAFGHAFPRSGNSTLPRRLRCHRWRHRGRLHRLHLRLPRQRPLRLGRERQAFGTSWPPEWGPAQATRLRSRTPAPGSSATRARPAQPLRRVWDGP